MIGLASRLPPGAPSERAGALLAVALASVDDHARQRVEGLREVDQVVARPGTAERRAQVRDRGPRVARERAQLGQEWPQLARDRLALLDQRVDVVERAAQIHERRVG